MPYFRSRHMVRPKRDQLGQMIAKRSEHVLTTNTSYVIDVRNLTKAYGKNEVLKGINLHVERGTMLALLGPNGAGKTTIVRILSTLLGFDSGTVRVDGHD